MPVREPGPRAAQAGLDLVEHQQPALAVAELAQSAQVAGTGDTDAAFALYGLDQHGDDTWYFLGRTAHCIDVVIGHAHKARHLRLEALLLGRVARGGECRQRAAMKSVLHHENLRLGHLLAMPVQAGELESRLIGLGTRIAEEHLFHAGERA